MESVDAVLRQAAADLDAIGARWAVIGGLAVAFRAEPRLQPGAGPARRPSGDHQPSPEVSRSWLSPERVSPHLSAAT